MPALCEVLSGGSFGSGPFGSVPMGSSMPAGLVLSQARLRSPNELCVQYTGDLTGSRCSAGSPFNVLNWVLEVLEPVGKCGSFVQVVVGERDGELCLFFDRPLRCGYSYQLQLLGQPEELAACNVVRFAGMCVDPAAQPVEAAPDGFLVDLANPFLPRDAQQTGAFLALGTYEITSTGDLAQDRGVAGLRKRIYRRAVSLAGEFFHLPRYGSDLEPKRLVRPDSLRRYQEKLRVQIEREPEVRAASVRISQVTNNPNVVAVYIRAQTLAGQSIDLNVPVTIP